MHACAATTWCHNDCNNTSCTCCILTTSTGSKSWMTAVQRMNRLAADWHSRNKHCSRKQHWFRKSRIRIKAIRVLNVKETNLCCCASQNWDPRVINRTNCKVRHFAWMSSAGRGVASTFEVSPESGTGPGWKVGVRDFTCSCIATLAIAGELGTT